MNEVIEKQIPAGKDPMGIAATVLYLSCLKTGEDTTQIQMAHAAGVTEITIRNRLKDLKLTAMHFKYSVETQEDGLLNLC